MIDLSGVSIGGQELQYEVYEGILTLTHAPKLQPPGGVQVIPTERTARGNCLGEGGLLEPSED